MAVMLTMKNSRKRRLLQLWTPLLSPTAILNHKQESQVTDQRIPTPLMIMMTVFLIFDREKYFTVLRFQYIK
jgi:hypothetical protein